MYFVPVHMELVLTRYPPMVDRAPLTLSPMIVALLLECHQ